MKHIDIKRESSSWNSWCVNYCGLIDHKLNRITHCKAGVEYEGVFKKVDFTYSREDGHKYQSSEARPCFKHEHPLTDGCPHCRFPTPEEIKANDEEMTSRINKLFAARGAIEAVFKQQQKDGGAGAMPCPVCKTGQLHYRRAASNGHIHAKCSTADCVSWME